MRPSNKNGPPLRKQERAESLRLAGRDRKVTTRDQGDSVSNIPSQRTAPPAPRRPATITVTELRCPSHGSAPFTAARPPSFPGPYQGYVPRVVGHVVLLVGDAVRMDEMDARITAQALVYADTVTIHGTDPEGVQRIQAALDFALDEAAEEAYLDALMRSDLPAPAQPEDKQEEAA